MNRNEDWTSLWTRTRMVAIEGQSVRLYISGGQVVSCQFNSREELTNFIHKLSQAQPLFSHDDSQPAQAPAI